MPKADQTMNRAEKRPKKKLATKASKPIESSPLPTNQQQQLKIQQAIDLSVLHHNAGDLQKAESIYKQILKEEPNHPIVLHLLGVIAHQYGKNEIAVDLIGKALAIKPNYAEARCNLGNVYKVLGRIEEAVANYYGALAIKPDYADAHYNLGISLNELNRLDEAALSYNNVLALEPYYNGAHINLGAVLKKLTRLDEAVEAYNIALTIKPDVAEAHNNLGNIFMELGKLDKAVASYKKALNIDPVSAPIHNNLGNAFKELLWFNEAIASYNLSLTIKPDYVEAHNNLAITFKELDRLHEAICSFNDAIAIKPDFAVAHYNLATTFHHQGKQDEAIREYDIALSLDPSKDGWRIRKTVSLSVIPTSLQDIQSERSQLIRAIDELQNDILSVDFPEKSIGLTNFYLAYHSQNNKNILESISKLHLSACPKLAYEAKHCKSKHLEHKSKRIRIGFLSSYFWRHTVGKLFKGVIEHFSKDQFEIIVFQLSKTVDETSKSIEHAADKVVPLSNRLDLDRETIAGEELDILFYLDIGMDPYTYFLSFARLAPVQAVTIGHAETSGVPSIDYFLSSRLTEPDDADEHYSEELIRLSYLPTYYYRPEDPTLRLTRSDYGLPEDKNLYLYPQSLFKLHPGLDATLGKLLSRDQEGLIVLISDNIGGNWDTLVRNRLRRSYPNVIDRVLFIPNMSYEKFLKLALLADAVLDNPFLSGTNSGLEMLGVGAPIVAWPGPYCSGNCVTACYRQMGLDRLIAEDEKSFIELALRLAHDADFKSQMHADIKANSHKLFECTEVLREMEVFFIEAYKHSQKGTIISNKEFSSLID